MNAHQRRKETRQTKQVSARVTTLRTHAAAALEILSDCKDGTRAAIIDELNKARALLRRALRETEETARTPASAETE